MPFDPILVELPGGVPGGITVPPPAPLPAIQPLCGVNFGGLLGCVRLFPASNVASVPPVVAGTHVGALGLKDAFQYLDVWFSSAEYSEPEKDDDQGAYFQPKLALSVPQDDPDLAASLAILRKYRYFVALYKDANGLTKLVGSPETPLRLLTNFETGNRVLDTNQHQLQFSAETTAAAGFYDTLVVVQPEGRRRAFASGFNFGYA